MPSRRVVAAVTVGQAPRNDILDELRALVPQVRWVEYGALDDVDARGVARLAPRRGDFPLVTRVRAGRPVVVSDVAVRPLLQRAIDRVATSADLVVVLCSTPLELQSPVPLLFPDRLLTAAVAALHPETTIGVVTPRADQIPRQQARWKRLGCEVIVVQASPFGATDFERIGRHLRRAGASVIVLDCLTYTSEMKSALARGSGLPTLLARSLVASMANEVVQPRPAAVAGPLPVVGPSRPRPRRASPVLARPEPAASTAMARRAGAGALSVGSLSKELRRQYALGRITPGDRLPSVRAAARQLAISPGTVADWYRHLQEQGVLHARHGSGTFLHSFGIARAPKNHEAAVLTMIGRVARQFGFLGMTLGDLGAILQRCADPARAHAFRFGCLMVPELYETVWAGTDARFGFALPRTLLRAGEPDSALVAALRADRSIACLVATHDQFDRAARAARQCGRGLILVQFDPRNVAAVADAAQPDRFVVTRDKDYAMLLRDLAGVTPGRPLIVHAGEPPAIERAIADRAATLLVSPVAAKHLPVRVRQLAELRIWALELSEFSETELLFRYLLSGCIDRVSAPA